MKKYLILDLDGTILDSMGMWSTLGRRYLKSKGIDDPYIDEECKDKNIMECSEYLKAKHNLESSARYIRLELNCMIEAAYFESLTLKSGVLDFLEWAKSHNYQMIICTETPKPLAEAALRRLNVLSYFKDVITTSIVRKSKAHIDVYDYCLTALNAKKEESVVFEDNGTAIKTVMENGYDCIGVKDYNNDYIYDLCTFTIDSFAGEKVYRILTDSM